MTLSCTSDHSTQSQANAPSSERSLPPSDELRPIRVGAVAQQPAPDITAIIFLGLAVLLPKDLRALCSSAGLFFARQIGPCAGGDLCRVEVAALSHYFSAGQQARKWHVRQIFLPAGQVAQLVEYSRSRASMATCDVRELVEAHAAQVRRAQKLQALANVSVVPDTLQTKNVSAPAESEPASAPGSEPVSAASEVAPVTVSVQPEAEHAARHPSREAPKQGSSGVVPKGGRVLDVDQLRFEPDRESVIIPVGSLQESVPVDPEQRPSSQAAINRFLLQAAIRHLRSARQVEKNWHERRALHDKERRIRRIFRLRGQVPTHKFIEITPVYHRGKSGEISACRLDIDVPVAA